jgi:mRNA-degrading endonuclease toxin of MazEF toxin-antitoxin module
VSLPIPEPGLVVRYGYLWRSEHKRGQEEGRKDRPCVIVLTVRQETGRSVVLVAPITHAPPKTSDEAVEIPLQTKQRLGLDDARSWVVVNEVNRSQAQQLELLPCPRGGRNAKVIVITTRDYDRDHRRWAYQ